jgi:tRNA1(Val) A37 N6-methylase TrmN6
VTHDAFLDGRLVLAQPARGFRAGLDSVLLGASVMAGEGPLLDLGAGAGAAALVALALDPGRTAILVERDPGLAALAADNAEANGFADRARVLALDLTAPGTVRRAAGLETDRHAAVIANPPYFAAGQGTPSPERSRAAARHMSAAALDLWVRTAAASAAPGAQVIFILPVPGLAALLAALDTRFGALTVLPLSPRPGEPASRVLVRGVKGSRAPLTLLSGRPVHVAGGEAFTPEMEAILRGRERLVW